LAGPAVLVVALLALTAGLAMGKGKPPKDPPPTIPDPDPAISYLEGGTLGNLMVMNADGSNKTVVLEGDGAQLGRADWSPDGKHLVFISDIDGLGVYVIDIDVVDNVVDVTAPTKLRAMIQAEAAGVGSARAVWSPVAMKLPNLGDDVERFRIAYQDALAPYPTKRDLFLIDTSGENRIQLTDTPEYGERRPSWSPSGTKLACGVGLHEWGLYDFENPDDPYTIDEFEGFIGEDYVGPDWAKTQEDKMAWPIGEGAYYYREIWVFDLDDLANPLRLTNNTNRNEQGPSWSPDDSEIVFSSYNRKGGHKATYGRLEVMSAVDGSNRRVIAENGWGPTWRRNP
jgi:dipeptidyl aminopeptidase/acylaminoacyl peptidase